MPKKRKTDKHLPERVYQKHNAFYYVDKKNKWTRLGVTFKEAMANWVHLVEIEKNITTMNDLFDRYMVEVAPFKAAATYKTNLIQIVPLKIFFGNLSPESVTPVDIYKYQDERGKKTKVSANREKSLLSHVFTMAIRWGIVINNPCKNVKRIPEKPRTRYIEDYEFWAVKNIASEKLQLIMDFAYLTAQRIGDILTIKLSDITEEGIRIDQNKTGNRLLISWSEDLRDCINKIKSLSKSNIKSVMLFSNRSGLPMTYDGFSTMWQRIMKKAIDQKLIEESFTFHDIRAKAASDAKNLEHASNLLGHSDSKLTARVYVRKPLKIVPLR